MGIGIRTDGGGHWRTETGDTGQWRGAGSDDGGLGWRWGWGDSQNGRRLHALCLGIEN